MDASVFREAETATAKFLKDYQPIVTLQKTLQSVARAAEDIGSFEAARAKAEAELAKVRTELEETKNRLSSVKAELEQAKKVHSEIVAKLSSFR